MRASIRAIVSILCIVAFLWGCATQDDLRYVSRSVDTKIAAVEEEMARIRKGQAELNADMIGLGDDIRWLRGTQEELQVRVEASYPEGMPEDLQLTLEQIEARLKVIEKKLAIPETTPGIPDVKRPDPDKPRDSETIYSEAYGLFKDGKFKESRDTFQQFLKSFPETEYSDNAQFWIGESYYFEGKYEEAILEYQKVIQDYPQGSRVPNALLKQALSFEKLGETSSATLLLQRVVRDFPGTTSAETARLKLLEIR
ncbi:MAG: tol-pal system protein YbgF [Syntrophales bacterium]|nr:tol-pal system protein YbgF [Syntrophales bacterium]